MPDQLRTDKPAPHVQVCYQRRRRPRKRYAGFAQSEVQWQTLVAVTGLAEKAPGTGRKREALCAQVRPSRWQAYGNSP